MYAYENGILREKKNWNGKIVSVWNVCVPVPSNWFVVAYTSNVAITASFDEHSCVSPPHDGNPTSQQPQEDMGSMYEIYIYI